MLIPMTGSGPTKADVAACLAKTAATLFLAGILLWPGIHSNLTLLKTGDLFSADFLSNKAGCSLG